MKTSMSDAKYTYEKLTKAQAAWYGSGEACFIVRFKRGAPIREFAAIENGKYTDNPKTGYIHGNGNTGTSSMLLKDISILNPEDNY